MPEVTDNSLVDRRYRIINRIGSGGMADVYSAADTHLDREVALKVLHRRFAEDPQFVERFRREASAAAALAHPNVVNVFDRGEHDGIYYIAMERLDGRTLKDLIGDEAPLDQCRAIDLAIQILEAAGFAHARGIVHRDFKPHNVIVADDDRAKVTDFGIARAGASEMTETGSILGTAQYFSPEQAQGQGVGPTSDLYSIGVMMYEMLAARPPFEGDSAVSIALKHVSEAPPPLTSLRPDIDLALEAAVMRALAKDPQERYQSAEEFIAVLRATRRAMANGTPRGQETAAFTAVPAALAEPEDPFAVAATTGIEPEEPYTAVSPPIPPAQPAFATWEPAPRDRRSRTWPLVLLALLLAASILATVFALTRPEQVRVPDVVDRPLVEASGALERAGFEIDVRRVKDSADVDQVVDQRPGPGAEADKGSAVTLDVSNGPGQVAVPSVDGREKDRARKELREAGFKVSVEEEGSDRVDKGITVRTLPPGGTLAQAGSTIRLLVSSGPEKAELPDVVGRTRSSAEALLEAAGFKTIADEEDSDRPEDEVTAQDPAAGTQLEKGSAVTIKVSNGRKVAVPDVTGIPEADARSELEGLGLAVDARPFAVQSEAENGIVVQQRPSAGRERVQGSTVVIFVGRFQTAPPPP